MPVGFPLVGAYYLRAVNQSVANNAFDTVVLDTEVWDTHSFFDSGHFTIPTGQAGMYVAYGKLSWQDTANDSAGVRGAGIILDGSENWDYVEWPSSGLSGAMMWQTVQGELRWLEEGQTVELQGYQFNVNGEALNIDGDNTDHPRYSSLQLLKVTWLDVPVNPEAI